MGFYDLKLYFFIMFTGAFLLQGCSNIKGSRPIINSSITTKPLPSSAKLTGLKLNLIQVNDPSVTNTQDLPVNATFNVDIRCPNVYGTTGTPAQNDYILSNLNFKTVPDIGNGSVSLVQYVGNSPVNCEISLNSMTFLENHVPVIYTYTASSTPKLILTINPSTIAATTNIEAIATAPGYGTTYQYASAANPGSSYYLTGANVTKLEDVTISNTTQANYQVTFIYSKVQNLAKAIAAYSFASVSFSIAEGHVPPPADPGFTLLQYPSTNAAGKYLYRLAAKAFLKNDGNSGATEAHAFFNNTSGPTTPFSLESAALGTIFQTQFDAYIRWYYLRDPALPGNPFSTIPSDGKPPDTEPMNGTAGLGDPYKAIVKYAGACKIFVIADSSLPFYSTVTVGSPANGSSSFFSTTPPPTGNNFPLLSDVINKTMSIVNLNALMDVTPSGVNGVYNCLDIRDYYTGTNETGTTVSASVQNHNLSIGKQALQKYFNPALPGQTTPSVVINPYDDWTRNQFFNWGNDDISSGSDNPLNYPKFYKYRVLIIYRNQETMPPPQSITLNAYTYALINPL